MPKKPVTIWIPGNPITKGRPRFRRGRTKPYTPGRTRDYERLIASLCRNSYEGPLLIGGLCFHATFVLYRGKTVKREHPHVKPDLDNLLKALMDAVKGILYKDDAQVCKSSQEKKYTDEKDPRPGIWVSAWQI